MSDYIQMNVWEMMIIRVFPSVRILQCWEISMWNFTHSSLDFFWTDIAIIFLLLIWVLLVLILSWDWKNGRIFYKHITKHFVFILPHRIRVGFSSPNDLMNSSDGVDSNPKIPDFEHVELWKIKIIQIARISQTMNWNWSSNLKNLPKMT